MVVAAVGSSSSSSDTRTGSCHSAECTSVLTGLQSALLSCFTSCNPIHSSGNSATRNVITGVPNSATRNSSAPFLDSWNINSLFSPSFSGAPPSNLVLLQLVVFPPIIVRRQ